MKKRWKIFWIVCGSMFLIGIICCSVSWGMGTTLTDIAHQFPHGISWVSEDKTYGDPDDDDDDDIDDDQEEDNETDTDDDQDEQKQEETVQAQEKANMKDATGVIEGNGKATYQNIHEIKSTVREGRIHLKTQSDTDEITVESKDTHEKLGFCAFAKNGTLYLTSNKKIKRIKNIGKGTITVTLPKDMELEKAELDLKAGELRAEQILAKDLEVNAGAGEVNILEFAAEKAEFKCGAGSITATGDAKKKIEADCGVGEINLKIKGKQKDYNYDLDCGIGEIRCGDDSFSGFGREKSIVGPRPERPELAEKYTEENPEFTMRLKVKAGITGFAQVYGRYNTPEISRDALARSVARSSLFCISSNLVATELRTWNLIFTVSSVVSTIPVFREDSTAVGNARS